MKKFFIKGNWIKSARKISINTKHNLLICELLNNERLWINNMIIYKKNCLYENINGKLVEFSLLENCSTIYQGRFRIYKYKNIIYKKFKKEKYRNKRLNNEITGKIDTYKNIIRNSYKQKYNHTIEGYDIEEDGSYKCRYIDGYRLDKLLHSNKDLLLIKKIKNSIIELKNCLLKNKNKLTGDWGLHNLIYSPVDDKIYNIDLEGFFTYKNNLPTFMSFKKINQNLDYILENITKN